MKSYRACNYAGRDGYNLCIGRTDIARLNDGEMLNDVVVEFGLRFVIFTFSITISRRFMQILVRQRAGSATSRTHSGLEYVLFCSNVRLN